MPKLADELLLLWLRDNAERCRRQAAKARAATKHPGQDYGRAVTTLAEAHEAAAEVYEAAAAAASGGAVVEAQPCQVHQDWVELSLTNGCRLVSHGDEYASGADVHVFDAAGEEIGFWAATEWAEEPEHVMGAILRCAARGCGADSIAPPTEPSFCGQDDEQQ